LQIAVRRFAERLAKAADEVRARQAQPRGERRHVERFGVIAVEHVAGAQQAPVGFGGAGDNVAHVIRALSEKTSARSAVTLAHRHARHIG
jgi:hypothetical protein